MGRRGSGKMLRRAGFGLLAVVLGSVAGLAQIKVGSETSLSANGELGVGYQGFYGNNAQGSSHGIFFTGLGQLNGYYYSPKFLNFNLLPYYNRNQDNSTVQSVLSETGINASVNLFGGSHFPGSVSFGKSWQTGSQFQIAGQPGLSADGSTQNFGVNWSALVPNWPTLSVSFSDSSDSQTLLGDTGATETKARFLNIFSNYAWDNFQFNGFYNHQNFDSSLPQFIGGSNFQTTSSGNAYGVGVSHPLPWSGVIGGSFTRYTYSTGTDSGTIPIDGTSDTAIASLSVSPTRKLGVSVTARWYDNLIGSLQQQGSLPPGSVPITTINNSVNGITVNSFASYDIGKGFVLVGYANRQAQHFEGEEFDSNQIGATLTYNYSRPLFGMLYFSFGMVNTAGNGNQGTVGFVGNLGIKKTIAGWDLDGDISYAQNVQSSIAWFTTSNYNYGGFARKRFGEFLYVTGSYREVQTGFTQIAGYDSRTNSALATVTRRWIGVSGSWSRSNGTSVLTNSGQLVPTPLPPVPGLDQVVYKGTVYGAGFNVTPVHRMIINVNWFRVYNNTQSFLQSTNTFFNSQNDSDRIYAQLQYNLRKLIVRSTYWRVNQYVSASGIPRVIDNTYSFSISRWFNFF
jgi:hypothetical protein